VRWTLRGARKVSFETFLQRLIKRGTLEVVLPGGRRVAAGDDSPPRLTVAIADHGTLARIMTSPTLGVGEAYMDGRLVMERGAVGDLVDLAARNAPPHVYRPKSGVLRRWLSEHTEEANARWRARLNVAHHYDLSADFYRLFLDEDMQYSCAYFGQAGASLEEAQEAKKRHIAAKLTLAPGHRVLDIGCGWGGLALSLVAWAGAHVHGVTLSTEQLKVATARAGAAGLDDLARFSLTDYRDLRGQYDRIVSVGMFEHVGRPNYGAFFDAIARLLTDDGVALIHSIGRAEGPSTTDRFTAKYIFPGGYIPALSEVVPVVERAGLYITDVEILRMHYAETLRCWRERFQASRRAAADMYDERFCRMWEYYLATAEASFRFGGHMNFQLQIAKRPDAVPIVRDYIAEAERALAAAGRPAG
jgi:cyclopropane-fatty-acyl-phospholipid synthase